MTRINQFHPIAPQPPVTRKAAAPKTETNLDFKEVLRQQSTQPELKFSNHCLKRMEQNDLRINPGQLDKLTVAVNKAALKGAKESCIVMDDRAFIVSISNKTVITVVDGARMKDNVFTNIDSAVII